MNMAPCKTCPERGCGAKHDTCEKYAEWLAQNEARKKANSDERVLDNVILKHRHMAFTAWVKKSRRRSDG